MRTSLDSAPLPRVLDRPTFDQLERERVLADVRRTLFSEVSWVRLGRFELRGRLGSGAMGVVYAAHDPELDRPVALKVLDPALGSEHARQRLLREAQALARLSHPSVVTVHEVGTSASRVYIAMELVDGDSLDCWLARLRPAWRDVLGVLLDAGWGIQAAHERGLVHRDIKPTNIMVDTNRRPRVVDFGLAQADVSQPEGEVDGAFGLKLTRTRAMLGTPAYAAPEQLEGRGADARSDQFSFAATAWEALVGRAPFDGDTVGARLEAIRHGVRVPRSPLRAVLHPLQRALAFDPAARHPSMRALLEALAREASRSRRWVAPVALGAIAIAVGFPAVFQYRSRAGTEPARAFESSLLAPGALLSCPVLDSSGVEGSGAWLGAAAASLACRRAAWILGGDPGKVLPPAALLGLPGQPGDAHRDPVWDRRDARPATLDAARQRATALLDGRVDKRQDGFHVELLLEHPPGSRIANASGTGLVLHVAVRRALERLEATGALPVAPKLDPDVARWTGIHEPVAGARLEELGVALETLPDPRARCAELEPLRAQLGLAMVGAHAACEAAAGVIRRSGVPLDRSSRPALAATAPAHFAGQTQDGAGERARAVARELELARRTETTAAGRRVLDWARSQILLSAGDGDRASVVLLGLADQAPAFWGIYGALGRSASARRNSSQEHVRRRAHAAWCPESPAAWEAMSSGERFECKDAVLGDCVAAPERVMFQRRAVELAPDVPIYSMHLALRLLEVGKVEETRALAARLSSSAEQRAAVAYILGLADAREGWLGRALGRMRRALGQLDTLSPNGGGVSLVMQTHRLAEVVGQRQVVAAEIARRFVLSDRALPDVWQALVPLVAVCMHAPADLARRCIEKIRAQRADGDRWPDAVEGTEQFVRGAERFVAGDARGAARAWRSQAATSYYAMFVPPDVFDEIGESELASTIDDIHFGKRGPYAGVHPAWAREAKRARLRGDRARSLRLARRVIEAWSVADVPVPAVAEMRALVAR